jgi:hypothetical protein
MTEIWREMCLLCLSLGQTNFFKINCSFKDFSTSSAENCQLIRETKGDLDLTCVQIIGKRGESSTQIRGRLRRFTVSTAEAPVTVFFLWVTVLKQYESTYTVETFGEETAGAASKVNHWSANTQYTQIQKLQLRHNSWLDSEEGSI